MQLNLFLLTLVIIKFIIVTDNETRGQNMIFKLIKDKTCREIEVSIRCAKINEQVRQLAESIKRLDFRIKCRDENGYSLLSLNEIYYFESVDDKTFVYMKNKVYECSYKLYELEKYCDSTGLVRISRNTIVNIYKIHSVKSSLNGRFSAKLINDETLIINRHYVSDFKKKFGI